MRIKSQKDGRKNGSILLETVFALFISVTISAIALKFVSDFSDANSFAEMNMVFRNYAEEIKDNIDNILENMPYGLESFPKILNFATGNLIGEVKTEEMDNVSGIAHLAIKNSLKKGIYAEDKYITDIKNIYSYTKCYIDFPKITDFEEIYNEFEFGTNNFATGLVIKGDLVIISTNSTVLSDPDLYIFSITESGINENDESQNSYSISLNLESSLNTGPGLNSLFVKNNYVYTANTGSSGQMQVIDIEDIKNPKIISEIKIASSTVRGVSVYSHKDSIYLGTTKSASTSELFVFNSSDLSLKGSFETNTQINSILVYMNFLLLATPNNPQFSVLDIKEENFLTKLNGFTPTGYQTQEGNVISRDRETIYFGRTVGGFNNVNNHEIFNLDAVSLPSINIKSSYDIGSSVYGVVGQGNNYVIATGLHESGIRIGDIFFPVDAPITDMKCSRNNLFISSKESKGLRVLSPKYE